MVSVKLSVSFSEELAAVLDELAKRRGDGRSPLIEALLRENPLVHEGILMMRKGAWKRLPGEGGLGREERRRPSQPDAVLMTSRGPVYLELKNLGPGHGSEIEQVAQLVADYLAEHPSGTGQEVRVRIGPKKEDDARHPA